MLSLNARALVGNAAPSVERTTREVLSTLGGARPEPFATLVLLAKAGEHKVSPTSGP